ncbi:hypothetical protein KR093_002127 [Drosophila rubida]|uniref:Uncharacterized protein n=1 Tax=Drosophila rubida TaxID=30044 RepID=A0AAD4K9Q3_9MUSC|nr:hypothetical protein KR093_002127 [Drosophila rubida]
MTARMLLSLFLDFFRCRRPFWRRATISLPDAGSTWSLSQIMDVPPAAGAGAGAVAVAEAGLAVQQTPSKEEPPAVSSDSDYDSVGNLEASDEFKDTSANGDCKINIINESGELAGKSQDNDDDGFDDPRLPEMII